MKKTIALMLVIVLCIVNLTACGSSEESKPSVYSVGDVLNFSNSNGEEYSVCITDWERVWMEVYWIFFH